MVVCSHCGRESRTADRYCQYCGQQLDPGNGHLVAALAPHYAGASGEAPEWQGPLTNASAASSSDQYSGQDVSQASSRPSSRARLVVRQMPESSEESQGSAAGADGREYQLDGGDVAIGRAPSCDVVLEGDQLASRRHALLRHKGDAYTIVDLGSSNGTYVNDLEIREATALKDGDVITIGAHEIVYSTAQASPYASIPGAVIAATPAAPLGETDPSASAVNSPVIPVSSLAAADQLFFASPEASEASAEDAGAQLALSEVDVPSDVRDAADEGEAVLSESSAEHAPVEAVSGPGEAGAIGAVAGAAVATTPATASGLDALRAQLAEISAALAHKADEEARTADRLRATLAEARDQLATLAEQRAQQPEQIASDEAPASTANVSELVTLARQAADNPRHLDYLTSLAAHAGEIAAALESLEARQASAQSSAGNAEVLDALNELRARLDAALEQH